MHCPLYDYSPLLTAVQASPSLHSILNTVTLSKLKSHHVIPLTQSKIPRVFMQSAAAPPTYHGSPPPLPLSPAATLPHCPRASHETSAGHGTAGHSHTCSVAPGRSSSMEPMASGWPSLGPRAGLVTPSPQPSKHPQAPFSTFSFIPKHAHPLPPPSDITGLGCAPSGRAGICLCCVRCHCPCIQ